MSIGMTEDHDRAKLETAIVEVLAQADRIGAHAAAIHLSAALEAVRGNQGPWTKEDVLAAIEAHGSTF